MSPNNNAGSGTVFRRFASIFEYEGDKVRLVSQQPVDMVVTGFDLPLTGTPRLPRGVPRCKR